MNANELEYILLRNHLQETESYTPRAVNQATISFDSLLKEMERGTAIRRADFELAINRFMNALEQNLSDGNKVRTPMGVFAPVLQGRLDSPDEKFNPKSKKNNHTVRLQWIPQKQLRKEVANNLKAVRVEGNKLNWPNPWEIKNITSPGLEEICPGDVLNISGVNLKFDQDDEEQGVFWIDEDSRQKPSPVLQNSPRSLMLQVPPVKPGRYMLELRFKTRGGKLRQAELYGELVVSQPVKVQNADCTGTEHKPRLQ